MAEIVETAQEISLNGVRYKVEGPIRSTLVSLYPPKVVIGDTGKDSHARASTVVWNDWRGGIGIDIMDGLVDVDRSWNSELQTRHKGQLVLPPLPTITAASGVSGSFDVGIINEYNNEIWASFGSSLLVYNNGTDSWGSTRSIANPATDSINFYLNATEYLIIAYTSGYDYFTTAAGWLVSNKNALHLAFWDDRLWGIDNDGRLWWSSTIGTEVDDAQMPLPPGNVNSIFVGRKPDGNLGLFVGTTRGLYAHDSENQTFHETELAVPQHPDNGLGANRWRDSTYFSSGLQTHKYINGANSAVITVMGPDRDHGLPTDKRGRIRKLLPSLNDLIFLIDATTAPDALTTYMSEAPSNGEVIAEDSGFSHILGWDERGYESKWVSGDNTKAITAGHVSNAYSDYRLWFAHNELVYWISLPRDINNPLQLTTQTYHTGPRIHETPWFDAGERGVDKLAVSIFIDVTGMSSDETVTLAWAVNDSSSYTTLGTITADGQTVYDFPNSNTPTGTEFRNIRFKITQKRGSTTTRSPNVRSLEFYYRKKLKAKWGHTVTVDLREDQYGGNSREEQFENIRVAVESNLKVEFTYRSRDANGAGDTFPYNYYVDVASAVGLEQTGNNWTGLVTLQLVEP